MALAPGSRLGVYEILAPIGAGGMGEVYRARDRKLDRDVAIKILPEALAADPERIARFEREAKTLAALNHPNIAHIYGVEEADSIRALVMELVEGPTLADRIAQGPIPIDEALQIAKQIAEALEAAHEQGIIHRDLKPANIKVRGDGTVKLLDFGLAKALDPTVSTPSGLTRSPTLSVAATRAGVLLGTAAYMAPEQARGRAVDKRADMWAFGCVLYEMLSGKRAFEDEDVSMTLSKVLQRDPDFDALPSTVPPRVAQVIRLCLRKDPRQRVADISDVRLALEGAFETAAPATPAAAAVPSRPSRLAWAIAAVAALAAVSLAVPALRYLRETPPAETRIASLTMSVAPAERLGPTQFSGRPSRTAFAISPDGATIVFSGEVGPVGSFGSLAAAGRTTMLYRRPLGETQATAIAGTEGAEYPFFSPDGAVVGFSIGTTTGNKLKKVALAGGPPIDVCDMAFPGRFDGASWGPSNIIVFALRGLWTVSSAGGKPAALVEEAPNARVLSPHMLPDGKTVLFTEVSSIDPNPIENAHIVSIDMATKQRKTILTSAADARYSPTGHLVFLRKAALLAVPFDASRLEIGAPVPLIAGIMQSTNAPNGNDETAMGQFALSASGVLVYASGDRYPDSGSSLVRVDRKGSETKIAETPGMFIFLRVSPSGNRFVGGRTGEGSRTSDIWSYELPGGTSTRLTSTGDAGMSLFSPDGKTLMFVKTGSNPGTYTMPLDGSGSPQRLMNPSQRALSWSSDGKWLAYLERVGGVNQIFVRPLRDGKPDSGEPRRISPSTFDQYDAEFSPDGRWLAYSTSESGALEVYVQPVLEPGEKRRISSNGGINPAWSRNGRELFYLVRKLAGAGGPMMAVDVSTTGDFKAGIPHQLLEGPYSTTVPVRSYDVMPDGTFIMNRSTQPPDQPVTSLNVVLGWASQLKTKVPVSK
jgi:Tol biopolymer transport system component